MYIFIEENSSSLFYISMSKVFGVAFNYLLYNNFNVFLASKGLIIDILFNLFVNNVVFNHEKGFHAFFERFLKSYVVYLSKCIEPL